MPEEPIQEILDRTLRHMGIRAAVRDAQVREAFTEVMGPAIAHLCVALRIERDVVIVATSNSALSHQLQMDAPRVLAALNARLGATVVRRMRFVPLEGSTPR